MKTNIEQTIDVLKSKVRQNLVNIQNNQKAIRELLKDTVSDERSTKLEELYAMNKVLLAENNDFITVQLTLSNFVDKYNNTDVFELQIANTPVFANEKDCFEKTVNGDVPFNNEHPYYNNDTFFQKLMAHYQTVEDYEQCSRLMKEKQ